MSLVASYQNKHFSFPADDIDPVKKLKPDWLKSVAEAIYGRYVSNQQTYNHSNQEKFDLHRKYGQGRQPKSKYIERYKSTQSGGDKVAKGFVNLDHEIFSVAPKFKAIMRQKVHRMKAEPQVRAIDEMSGAEREEAKWGSYFHSTHGNLIDIYEQTTGTKVEKPDFIPSSLEELELFSEINGFKVKSEIAYNRALKHTDEISNWNTIERKLIDDLIDIGACVMKDYVDPEDGKVKIKYIDIARFTADYTLNHGFDKSRYFAHFEDYTIAELRYYLPNVDEGEWKNLAEQNVSYGNNSSFGLSIDDYDVQSDNGTWGYNDYKVSVLEWEFLTVDTKYQTKHTNAYGDVKYYDDTYGKVRDTKTKQTTTMSIRNWYNGNWIVGSDYSFDSGKQTDIPRPEMSKPRSSYHAFRMNHRSFIEIIKTNLDQIQLAYLSLQQALANSTPDGLAIEWSALENITLGGEETGPMELLRIHSQTGNLIYRATTHRGNQAQSRPVIPLQGGAGKMFQDAIQTMEFHFNMIAELTGIDRYAAGMTPSAETSATASQIANMGSDEMMNDLAFGYKKVKESCAINVAHRVALRVKHSKKAYKIYRPALGHNTEILKITADNTPAQMGIYMRMAPNMVEKERIAMAAADASKIGQIDIGDYLRILRIAEEGNLQFAEAMLNQKIRRSQEQEQANKVELTTAQNEGLNNIKETEGQNSKQKIVDETEKMITIEKEKGEQTRQTNKELHEQKMNEIHAEAQNNKDLKETEEQTKTL